MRQYEIDKDFQNALHHEDDLGAVIRVHLHLETYVNKIIDLLVYSPEDLKPIGLDYFGKVHLIIALGADPQSLKVLLALGRMRNKFAHDLNYKLDRSNVKNLYETLSSDLKEMLQSSHNKARNRSEFQSVDKFEKLSPKSQFILISVFVKIMLERIVTENSESPI
ncbi:hypothetical protein [Vibrio hyugaensis]|uniref:hypothetical protein n=1 Tax=Vibrio hyugaensis TaxID=1534743 RepID=UPI000CE5030A|nr:hypothetical protein [Vibrio hyugaensis]